ncbi:hypothetical protein [Rufibacter quisquiliarum]|uniref:Outer membrane protein beta-barrel domain-containing protein n=1 Tax=Rufibacter quisquiliarum TaxID=1549639 RepID=A0A839GUC1_9BACT|nr:hypothetical protein [Rufibacter quisquiliarum]MBA9078477.1 hypothetical protein [Rufibacter quisquiliarum]
MKKTVLALVLWAAAFTGRSQNLSGALLSGSLKYSTQTIKPGNSFSDDTELSSFSISPSIGFFISNSIALGGALSYSNGDTRQSIPGYGSTVLNSEMLAIGPFLRYYKLLGTRAAFFGQATGAYVTGSQGSEDNEVSVSGAAFGVAPGFVFFPTTKIGLELVLGGFTYQSLEYEQTDFGFSQTENNLDFNLGLNNLTLGITFYLGRAAKE